MKKKTTVGRGTKSAVHGHALRAMVQILSATGQPYTVETLRERLREFFVAETDRERRAVASLSAVELVGILLEGSARLEPLGLRIQLVNGTARLSTGVVESAGLGRFLAEKAPTKGTGELSQAALEVLSCVAFKQPVTQAEIDRIFGDVDKRHLMGLLRQSGLIEEFAGPDGRLRFATTAKFLSRFGLGDLAQMRDLMR